MEWEVQSSTGTQRSTTLLSWSARSKARVFQVFLFKNKLGKYHFKCKALYEKLNKIFHWSCICFSTAPSTLPSPTQACAFSKELPGIAPLCPHLTSITQPSVIGPLLLPALPPHHTTTTNTHSTTQAALAKMNNDLFVTEAHPMALYFPLPLHFPAG